MNKYLVVYDYGQGGVWAFVTADSADQIRQEFPELTIFEQAPAWMTKEVHDEIERTMTFDIHGSQPGLLANIRRNRSKELKGGT